MIEKLIKLKQLLQIDYLNKYPGNLNLRMEMIIWMKEQQEGSLHYQGKKKLNI